MKPNNKILYVHRQGDHLPAWLKNIPQNINKRLLCISSTQPVFNEAVAPYQKGLDNTGYNFKLTYICVTHRRTAQTHKTAREPATSYGTILLGIQYIYI